MASLLIAGVKICRFYRHTTDLSGKQVTQVATDKFFIFPVIERHAGDDPYSGFFMGIRLMTSDADDETIVLPFFSVDLAVSTLGR